jgi:excisionase family DNA binding protein
MAKKRGRKIPVRFVDMPEVMTPQQTQELLQISRATFFRWVQAGKLPGAVKIGDSWRVMRDQLRAYLEHKGQQGGS